MSFSLARHLSPTTMRSGCLKSLISRSFTKKFRIFEATPTSASTFDSRMRRSTSSPVPMGTVDFATTTAKPFRLAAISCAAE
jgi:hypothetical protein